MRASGLGNTHGLMNDCRSVLVGHADDARIHSLWTSVVALAELARVGSLELGPGAISLNRHIPV